MKNLIVVLALVMASSACSDGSGEKAVPSGDKTVIYQADYPQYSTADKLYAAADLVILADVGKAVRVQELKPETPTGSDPKLNPAAGAPTQADAPQDDAMVITVFEATVKKVIKGTATVGQVIEVQQSGGEFKGVTYQEADAHALKQNAGSLLFLETYPTAPAALLNPLQGQYPLDASGEPTELPGNTVDISSATLKKLSGKP
jgi:hypothetical protein